MRHVHGTTMLLMLLLATAPSLAHAQTTTLDQGAFRILIMGREFGRETFTIRQTGSGATAVVMAEGHVTLNDSELTSSMELKGSDLRPAAYQMQVTGNKRERIAGQVVGNRFSARILSPSGEQMREYLAGNGALIVDDGIAHQYYFIARRADDKTVTIPLLVPRENRQVMVQVQPDGHGTVDIGGHKLEARKLLIRPTDGEARTLWVDKDDRVLRLDIPAHNYEAIRVAPPA